ncbi:murein L,D-transpeptidase catalytic domain family protein [Larkinella sp. GY13]|uniref:murein L,D-transpeptidase catalytic domain family protein n=1 Tax=Larkinella sp. GY13 TaxID=3453720 RepID=UPI003EEE2060
MKKALLILLAILPLSLASVGTTVRANAHTVVDKTTLWAGVYDGLNLERMGLQKEVFDYALRGLQKTKFAKSILSIVDLSQPSNKKRLYVIDLDQQKLLFQTYVAHGRNSGELMAASFSNTFSSFQSSLGFYQTLNTYQGKHGLSLQLKGLEQGFNDNAFSRAIVMHGADYVCEDFIRKTGRLGRSQGCPAIANAVSKDIIQAIKGGSCLFVYSPSPDYLQKSTFLL